MPEKSQQKRGAGRVSTSTALPLLKPPNQQLVSNERPLPQGTTSSLLARELPKLATRCLRTGANNAPSSKTKNPVTFSPELPHLRTNFQLRMGNSAAPCPAAITKQIRLAPPAQSHGSAITLPRGINPKMGAAAPFIGRWGIVKGAIRKAPLTAFLYTAGGAFFPRGKERGAEPPP